MLTLVLTTAEAPSMEDAYDVLKRAILEVGTPDYVYVIDLVGDAVFSLQQGGIARQVTESAQEIPHIFGNCALVMSGVDSQDDLLRDWFEKIEPEQGQHVRLLEVMAGVAAVRTTSGDSGGVVIHDEKPMPPSEEWTPGTRILRLDT